MEWLNRSLTKGEIDWMLPSIGSTVSSFVCNQYNIGMAVVVQQQTRDIFRFKFALL